MKSASKPTYKSIYDNVQLALTQASVPATETTELKKYFTSNNANVYQARGEVAALLKKDVAFNYPVLYLMLKADLTLLRAYLGNKIEEKDPKHQADIKKKAKEHYAEALTLYYQIFKNEQGELASSYTYSLSRTDKNLLNNILSECTNYHTICELNKAYYRNDGKEDKDDTETSAVKRIEISANQWLQTQAEFDGIQQAMTKFAEGYNREGIDKNPGLAEIQGLIKQAEQIKSSIEAFNNASHHTALQNFQLIKNIDYSCKYKLNILENQALKWLTKTERRLLNIEAINKFTAEQREIIAKQSDIVSPEDAVACMAAHKRIIFSAGIYEEASLIEKSMAELTALRGYAVELKPVEEIYIPAITEGQRLLDGLRTANQYRFFPLREAQKGEGPEDKSTVADSKTPVNVTILSNTAAATATTSTAVSSSNGLAALNHAGVAAIPASMTNPSSQSTSPSRINR